MKHREGLILSHQSLTNQYRRSIKKDATTMRRSFPMTPTAQQATWCQLSTGVAFIPTQFLVDGDAKDGYEISHVDNELCGFTIIKLRSFYGVKMYVDQVNKTGTTDFEKYCSIGTFAWRNTPLPTTSLILSSN